MIMRMVSKSATEWIAYIPFPDHLRSAYQSYTQADIGALRSAGYSERFLSIQEGVSLYLDWLNCEN